MTAPKEVVVTGVNIPFVPMVWLILKWSLASIPAMFLLSLIGVVAWALTAGFAAAIISAVGAAT